MTFTQWIHYEIGGNPLWRFGLFFSVVLAGLVLGKILKFYMMRWSSVLQQKNQGLGALVVQSLAKSAVFVFAAIGLREGVQLLILPAALASAFSKLMSVLLTLCFGLVAYYLVDVVDQWFVRMASRTKSKLDDMMAPLVRKSLRVTIVIAVVIQVADTLSDEPVTSLLAGLGVGGLAVALAAQDTVKNFFGSLVILADKPFEMGDRVRVDGFDGPIEEVGFRSTKIRTLDGHVVTIPNGELANKTIENIGRRPYIKKSFEITVTYDTTPEKVERAVEILKEILENHQGMNPDFPPRIFFESYHDASLGIRALYWFHPPDYWAACDFHEKVNLQILRRFNAEGIDFAFPTQTLYVAGDPQRPLTVGVRNDA